MIIKNRPFIIGEVASAHEGNYLHAIKIGKAAYKAGADSVKFQIFKCDALMSSKNPQYQKFKKLEIKQNDWIKVFKKFNKKNFLIAETFDIESLIFAINLKVFKMIKIPSTCLVNKNMLQALKSYNKTIILASGGASFAEINFAIKHLKKKRKDIVIMAGFQNFPTKIEDTKLSQIRLLKKTFKTIIGYADHTDSNISFFPYTIPLMAFTSGADIIEKHITLDRKKKGTDYQSSLNPNEFKKFTNLLKKSFYTFSKEKWELTKAEENYRKFNKIFAVAKKNLKKGIKINQKDILFKRTNKSGITPDKIYQILGKKLKKDKKFDEIILSKDLN